MAVMARWLSVVSTTIPSISVAGNQGAFNTVAIPEPGSALLLSLVGAAGFVFYRRKHARGSGVRG